MISNTNIACIKKYAVFAALLLCVAGVFIVTSMAANAQATATINYQGKLLDGTGSAVADGNYNIRFWLLQSTSQPTASAVWSEELTGADQVTVENGLFSVMLGSTTPLTGVDFDQTLFLGVEVGGTGTPTWDGEMLPRKPLGTVPAAFQAFELGGVASTSFLRSDQADSLVGSSAAALFTIQQSGSGAILDVLTGGGNTALTASNAGTIGIGTSTPSSSLTVDGDFWLTGGFRDSEGDTGTNGQLLITTGTGTNWVATSTLGFGSGGGGNPFGSTINANELAAEDFGSFTCSGVTCVLDNGSVTTTEIANGTVNFADINMTASLASNPALAARTAFFGANGILFEGLGVNNNEGLLTTASLGADRTWTLPGASGIVALTDSALTGTFDGNNFSGGAIGTGQLLFGSAAGSIAELNVGTDGQILSVSGGLPAWTSTSTLGLGGSSLFTDGGATTYLTQTTDNFAVGTTTSSAKLTVAGDINIADPAGRLLVEGEQVLYASSSNTSVAVGTNAGQTFNSGQFRNTAIGFEAGQFASTTGALINVYVGYRTGQSNTGTNNNMFGAVAGASNSGDFNNLMGQSAGFQNEGDHNNLFGNSAGRNNTGLRNNFLGQSAGENNTGTNNNGLGFQAGTSNTGNSNNFLGQSAGQSNTGSNNNLFGNGSGTNNDGSNNNIFGLQSGFDNTGSNNNIFGSRAGFSNTGNYNEFIGSGAAALLQASGTIAIGAEALRGGSASVFAGTPYQAINNVAIGYRAGYNAENGANNNILLGYQAADSLTTGANNIVIGYDIEAPSNTQDNQLNIGNLLFGTGIDGVGTTLSSGGIGIGTTSPNSKLTIANDTLNGTGVSGINQFLTTTNAAASAVQFGERLLLDTNNTATTTSVASLIQVEDDTTLGNTVRGLEVQTNRGANTQGENTAISGFARTFGVRGVTSADAGGEFEPAGGFFETEGTTQGNALRAYSGSITTATLLSLFQDTSNFTGTGLEMNFGNTAGDFSSNTSKYVDFQNAGSSVFTVSAFGTTTIGDGTTNNMAGLQIGFGGICVDNDGSCTASTTGRITSVEAQTGNSDLAEMYFSRQALLPGEIVTLAGELSVNRAVPGADLPVLGVVSTKPGLTLGFDDVSTRAGETGFPIALSGRVPIRLSTENGPIKKGDQLMLSSLPGIAMKASSTGAVVGYALEDFNDSRMYSDTYLNQFGDDMVDPIYTPVITNTDPRINDGCYFGGGGTAQDAPCVPLQATTSVAQINEVNQQLRSASVAQQVAALKQTPSERRTLNDGTRVRVGQVVMFVDTTWRWLDDNQAVAMTALTDQSMITEVGDVEDETLFDRLVALANSFVDGVFSVFTLRADRVEVAETLCLDDVCLSADDLREMLDNQTNEQPITVSDQTDNPPIDNTNSQPPVNSDTTVDTDTNTDNNENSEGADTNLTASSTEIITDTASTSVDDVFIDDGDVASTTPETDVVTTTEIDVVAEEETSSTTEDITDNQVVVETIIEDTSDMPDESTPDTDDQPPISDVTIPTDVN